MMAHIRTYTLENGALVDIKTLADNEIQVCKNGFSNIYGFIDINDSNERIYIATKYQSNGEPIKKTFSFRDEAIEWVCIGLKPEPIEPKSKNLTLRLNSDHVVALDRIMSDDHHKTASKAIISLIMNNEGRIQEFLEYQSRAFLAENEVKRLKSVIENARLSAVSLAQCVSQNDIFQNEKVTVRSIDTSLDIEHLELTRFCENSLKEEGIIYIKSLLDMTDIDLLKLPKVGKRSLLEIKEVLSKFNLSLKERSKKSLL